MQRYWYHTPAGRHRTLRQAAEANDLHRRTLEDRINNKNFPEYYKTKKKPASWWKTAPVAELSETLLARRRKWETERKQHILEKNRKTPEELAVSRKAVAEKIREIQLRPENRYRLANLLTPETIAQRAKTHSENYWKKIEESPGGIEKHKEKKKVKNRRYDRKWKRKRARKTNRRKRRELEKKRKLITGLKIWLGTNDNHYVLFDGKQYITYRRCLFCKKEEDVYHQQAKFCSVSCYWLYNRGPIWTRKLIENLEANPKSFSRNAFELNVSLGTLLNAYRHFGIVPKMRFRNPKLSSWLSRTGNYRPSSELSEVLKDTDRNKGTEYLPDEIERYMDELDDFFE